MRLKIGYRVNGSGGIEAIKPGDKSGTAILEKGQDRISYTLAIPDFDEDPHGQKLVSTARANPD
jgi:hypothetical protein